MKRYSANRMLFGVGREPSGYDQVAAAYLKQALWIFIIIFVTGNFIAVLTDPYKDEAFGFLKYRAISIASCILLYAWLRRRSSIQQYQRHIFHALLYTTTLLPYLVGTFYHYFYLFGLTQVWFVVTIFFPANFYLHLVLSLASFFTVAFLSGGFLLEKFDPLYIQAIMVTFYMLLFICIVVNYYINKLRLNDFLQKQRLQELDRLKSDFFSNVSHELRTPLTMLISPLESIISDVGSKVGAKVERYTKVAHENALYLLEMINKLLDFAKIDAGRMTVHLGKGDMDELVRGVTSRFTEYGKKHSIDISVDSKGPQQGYFDHEMVKRIANNLLSNAVKFMKEGGKIDVRLSEDSTSHIIEVEDTGPGIQPEDRDAIFDRFTQKSKSGRAQGTGIGLALSREYARLHKGDITVDSELGKGSCFRVTLQKGLEKEYEVKEVTEVEEAKHIDLLGVTEEDLPEITVPAEEKKDQKVLVVEDHQRLREYLASLFVDYQVVTAASGEEGLQAFMENKPDVVISDMMMETQESGITLCREVRQQEGGQEIPFIFLTARADIKVKIAGLEAGGVEYLTKPFNPLELRARVENLLSFVELNQEYKRLYRELEETKEHLVHMEKMSSLGTLVSGIAHEIRNPLAHLKGSYQAIEEEFDKVVSDSHTQVLMERVQPCLGVLGRGIERIKVIVDQLHRFSRKELGPLEQVDLNTLLDEVLTILASRVGDGVRVLKDYGADCVVMGSYNRLSQVFLNVLQNAVDALDNSTGCISISTRSSDREVRVFVRDDGDGIEPMHLKQIFDPFFTTKDMGTGLGLSVSYDIIKQHRGDISITSKGPDQGTEVRVCLPREFTLPDRL